LSDAFIDTPDAPDIVMSASWSAKTNRFNVSGLLAADSPSDGGTHGSLSEWDIHNTLLAAGPDIRRGFRDLLPSGNVDVAPTILHLLGIQPEKPMDGRILAEALDENHQAPKQEITRIERKRDLGDGKVWIQTLQFTNLGGAVYLDHGNSSAAK
jgi:arylsulfatase A-like enzyme